MSLRLKWIWLGFGVNAFALIALACSAAAAATNEPMKRVLILHSFGPHFAPFNVMSAAFRSELAQQAGFPLEFHEASIETARFAERLSEEVLKVIF